MVGLRERISQRTAGITQVIRQFLWSMQVAERDVVNAVEHRSGYEFHTADRDAAFGLRAFATGDERVRQHDGADTRTTGEIGAHRIHRLGQHALMPARGWYTQRVPSWFWLQVRDSVESHRAVPVVEQHRPTHVGDPGTKMQTAGRGEFAERAEPGRGIVVARDDDEFGASLPDSGQYPGTGGDRFAGRYGAVVQVAGAHDDIDVPVDHEVGQPAEHRFLVGEQVAAVEHASHVPVGGVQHAHATNLDRLSDRAPLPSLFLTRTCVR